MRDGEGPRERCRRRGAAAESEPRLCRLPFRIFPGRYPLCKGVIHVEIVENPVEKVENSPVFSVETVENPVEIPRQRVLEEKFSTIPSWRRGRLLDKGPGYVYNKNNQNCAKE